MKEPFLYEPEPDHCATQLNPVTVSLPSVCIICWTGHIPHFLNKQTGLQVSNHTFAIVGEGPQAEQCDQTSFIFIDILEVVEGHWQTPT